MNSLKNLTLLLVEDEKNISSALQTALEEFFDKIIIAKNGEEGLKKFKKYSPDLVVTDISMPIMDGLTMSSEIKKVSKNTPIIVLSAYSEKEKLLEAIDIHINKYLIKPIDVEELLMSIHQIVHTDMGTSSFIKLDENHIFDKTKRIFIKNDEEIPLTKKELAFISVLLEHPGVLVLHSDIKKRVWASDTVKDAAVRTFVKRLRDKIGDEFIKNISGLGYKIEIDL